MSHACFPVAVHLLLKDEDGNVLFQRRAGTGYADGRWSVPAGHVEVGETLHDACVRECLEELGVRIETEGLQFLLIQQKHDVDGQERVDAFFTAPLPEGAEPAIAEPERCDGLIWTRPERPPSETVAYVAAALRTILRSEGTLAYYGYRS